MSCTLCPVYGCHQPTLDPRTSGKSSSASLCTGSGWVYLTKKMDLGRVFEPCYLFLNFFFCHFFLHVFQIDQLIIGLAYRLNLHFLHLTWLKKKIKKIDNKTPYGFFCNGCENKKFSSLKKSYLTTKKWCNRLKIYKRYNPFSCTD